MFTFRVFVLGEECLRLPGICMIDSISFLNLAPGNDGEDMIIREREAGVLVAAVHHHRSSGKNTYKLKIRCSAFQK